MPVMINNKYPDDLTKVFKPGDAIFYSVWNYGEPFKTYKEGVVSRVSKKRLYVHPAEPVKHFRYDAEKNEIRYYYSDVYEDIMPATIENRLVVQIAEKRLRLVKGMINDTQSMQAKIQNGESLDFEILILDAWKTKTENIHTDEDSAIEEDPNAEQGYIVSGGTDIRDYLEDYFDHFYTSYQDVINALSDDNLMIFKNYL